MTVGEKYHVPAGQFHTVHCLGDNPAMYMYIYQNSTDVEYRKKFKILREIDQYDSKEDLPSNLTNYFTPEEESHLREYFYGSKSKEEIKVARKEKVVQFKKSFYGKTLYWCDKKIRNVRRGVLLGQFHTYFSMNFRQKLNASQKDIKLPKTPTRFAYNWHFFIFLRPVRLYFHKICFWNL